MAKNGTGKTYRNHFRVVSSKITEDKQETTERLSLRGVSDEERAAGYTYIVERARFTHYRRTITLDRDPYAECLTDEVLNRFIEKVRRSGKDSFVESQILAYFKTVMDSILATIAEDYNMDAARKYEELPHVYRDEYKHWKKVRIELSDTKYLATVIKFKDRRGEEHPIMVYGEKADELRFIHFERLEKQIRRFLYTLVDKGVLSRHYRKGYVSVNRRGYHRGVKSKVTYKFI